MDRQRIWPKTWLISCMILMWSPGELYQLRGFTPSNLILTGLLSFMVSKIVSIVNSLKLRSRGRNIETYSFSPATASRTNVYHNIYVKDKLIDWHAEMSLPSFNNGPYSRYSQPNSNIHQTKGRSSLKFT